jgi:hypothetical protein
MGGSEIGCTLVRLRCVGDERVSGGAGLCVRHTRVPCVRALRQASETTGAHPQPSEPVPAPSPPCSTLAKEMLLRHMCILDRACLARSASATVTKFTNANRRPFWDTSLAVVVGGGWWW